MIPLLLMTLLPILAFSSSGSVDGYVGYFTQNLMQAVVNDTYTLYFIKLGIDLFRYQRVMRRLGLAIVRNGLLLPSKKPVNYYHPMS